MFSRVATTRPRLYQGSVRSVRSAICARVLPAGASEICVIQRPRCLVRARDPPAQAGVPEAWGGRARGVLEFIPVSRIMPHRTLVRACELDYTAPLPLAICPGG